MKSISVKIKMNHLSMLYPTIGNLSSLNAVLFLAIVDKVDILLDLLNIVKLFFFDVLDFSLLILLYFFIFYPISCGMLLNNSVI